jgi:N-acetylmuramic acid 6-phosphate etherase
MTHPADRSGLTTEKRNPRTMDLHRQGVAELVATIHREDRKVIEAMKRAAHRITRLIEAIEPGFLAGGRLVYVGAGTSGRLGVLDASEAPPTFQVPPGRIVGIIAGGDPALRVSSEGREDDPRGAWPELDALQLTSRDAVIAIAAGGTTPYALGALEFCAARTGEARPLTCLLSCADVPRPAAADHLLILKTGPEVLTGSTRMKAGTATKLALNTISTTLMIRSGRVYENLMVDLRATNDKLRDRAARIVATLTGLERSAAFALLDSAGGSVKVAVVMHRRSFSAANAEAALRECSGRLDRALGEPEPRVDDNHPESVDDEPEINDDDDSEA